MRRRIQTTFGIHFPMNRCVNERKFPHNTSGGSINLKRDSDGSALCDRCGKRLLNESLTCADKRNKMCPLDPKL